MTDQTISVDCYVRTASLAGPVAETVTTVQGLVDDGTIDECTIHLWPTEVVLSELTGDADAVETYRAFEAWADQRGVRIEPPFIVETRTSRITNEQREVLVTPALCLAVSVEETLWNVFPHHTDDTIRTVEDGLTTLTRGEEPPVIG